MSIRQRLQRLEKTAGDNADSLLCECPRETVWPDEITSEWMAVHFPADWLCPQCQRNLVPWAKNTLVVEAIESQLIKVYGDPSASLA